MTRRRPGLVAAAFCSSRYRLCSSPRRLEPNAKLGVREERLDDPAVVVDAEAIVVEDAGGKEKDSVDQRQLRYRPPLHRVSRDDRHLSITAHLRSCGIEAFERLHDARAEEI